MFRRLAAAVLLVVSPHGPAYGAQPPSVHAANSACGSTLFQDENLWDDNADRLAAYLGLPLQSRTSGESSFRSYRFERDLFGAQPNSVALYARDGHPEELSIVFSNLGDSASFDPDAREQRRIQQQIRDEAKALEKRLTAALGPGKRDFAGPPGPAREAVLRWDVGPHSLLLASPKDAYVALRIIPASRADEGAAPKVSDATLRATLKQRVLERPGGDVVVSDIPMVDQGPKGYCVPATWERVLRYLGIPADLYVLALAAGTGTGGGTTLEGINRGAERLLRQHGRRLVEITGKPSVPAVRRYIDDGVPVIWPMFSSGALNRRLSVRSEPRAKAFAGHGDVAAVWRDQLRSLRQGQGRLPAQRTDAHVCLIIGYNRTTGELAVSDSWGPEFAERWISEEEAQQVSQGGLLIIQW